MTIVAGPPKPEAFARTPKERPKRIGLGASGRRGAHAVADARCARGCRALHSTNPRDAYLGHREPRAAARIERVKIVVSGASGFIGSALVPSFEAAGHEVVRLVRREASGNSEVSWDPGRGRRSTPHALGVVDAIVNLSGATIEKRWTAARQREIIDSRVDTTSPPRANRGRARASSIRLPVRRRRRDLRGSR